MAALLNRTDYGVLSTGPAISVTSGCSTLRLKENLKSKRSLTSTVHLPAFHVGVETQTVSESNWTQAEAVQEMVVFVILNGTSRKMLFWMAASYYGIQTLQTHIEANHLYTYINHAYYIGKRHFFKKCAFPQIQEVFLLSPFYSALSMKNILTQKPVSIKVSIP